METFIPMNYKNSWQTNFHHFKRGLQKMYIHLHRKFVVPDVLNFKSDHEMECISICKRLIKMDDSILLMTPVTDKRYIKNEALGIYVIMEKHHVQVINHIYSYSVSLGEKSWTRLIDFYNEEIEERRLEFEKEITANIKHSLKNILHGIEEKL
jgi:hypothetical protein